MDKQLNQLNYKYLFHFILSIIIIIIHIILYLYIQWPNKNIRYIFIYFSIFHIIYIAMCSIQCILINIKKFKYLKIHIVIGKIFLILSIIFGFFFSILIIINTIFVKTFCLECPFNLSNSYFFLKFHEIFQENQEKYEIKDNCNKRRCILNRYNPDFKYQYDYLCNYNPEKEFGEKFSEPYSRTLLNGTEIKTYKQVECVILEPIYRNVRFDEEIIYNYLDICYFLTDFYYCNRFDEPKKYEIKDEECPNDNYFFLMGLICVSIIIFDLFLSFIPWYIENKSYKNLIEEIDNHNNQKSSNEKKNKENNENNINNINNNSRESKDNEKKVSQIKVLKTEKTQNTKSGTNIIISNFKEEKKTTILLVSKVLTKTQEEIDNIEVKNNEKNKSIN